MVNDLFVKYTFLALIWVVIHISTISGSKVIEFWKIVRIFGPKLGYFCARETVHASKQLRRVPRRVHAIAHVLLTALPTPHPHRPASQRVRLEATTHLEIRFSLNSQNTGRHKMRWNPCYLDYLIFGLKTKIKQWES